MVTLVLALLQGDGIGLNVTTFGVVSAVVLALVGAITFLFKYASSGQNRYIDRLEKDNDRLEREKQELTEALIDVLRTAHRSTDAADEAAKELLKQTTRTPKR